ncbi:hypothetical protein FKP32DRAFT_1588858 [Trametes sanguinea]|nr:hypothetical protein FKP32DRAFT_1588858 [Trametes sanguinea]
MSLPNLFRHQISSTPLFDRVRVGLDVDVQNGSVSPASGGISTFSHKPAKWADNELWVLARNNSLGADLQAINDYGTHWLIAPTREMTLEEYKGRLADLSSKAVPYSDLRDNASGFEAEELVIGDAPVFKDVSTHPVKMVRCVYEALAAVAQQHTKVQGWDENDCEYVGVLAQSLDDGKLQLSALVWDPANTTEGGWGRERAFAARAVAEYIAQELARAEASGDDDQEADVLNFVEYLRVIFRFSVEENPFRPPADLSSV